MSDQKNWTLPPDIRAYAAQAAGILLALANDNDPVASARSVINTMKTPGPEKDRMLATLDDIQANEDVRGTMAAIAVMLAEKVANYLDPDDESEGMRA